jgi:ArsR family transcriptional regulator
MPDVEVTPEKVGGAAAFLKALANEHRLLVLCHLADGEKSVTQLEQLLQIRQPTLSQQLARLRAERLVKTRRDAKHIYYSLDSEEARLIIELLYQLFCSDDAVSPESLTLEFIAAE